MRPYCGCELIGCLRQARNALLAAYHILDDDGMGGLSRDQLVGVLTTEAGVGIDTGKVKKNDLCWQTLRILLRYFWEPVCPWGNNVVLASLSLGNAVGIFRLFL